MAENRTVETVVEEMEALASKESFSTEDKAKFAELELELEKFNAQARVADLKKPVRNDLGVYAGVAGADDQDEAFSQYLRTGDRGYIASFDQNKGTPSDGGYTVPDGFRNKLVEKVVSYGGIATVAETITTADGRELPWMTNDDTSNVGEIVAEGSPTAAGADLVFGTNKLGAFSYSSNGADGSGADPLRVSLELLQDSALDVQAFVARKLGERIGRKQAVHWAVGAGTTEPYGLFSKAADINTSATPDYDDLVDIYHSLDPYYRQNGVWIMADETLAELRKIKDKNDRPILEVSTYGANQGLSLSIFGHRIVVDNASPTGLTAATPSGKYLAFGDIREAYVIRRVRDVQVLVDPYTRMAYRQVCFTAWARADGTIQNPDAFVVASV